jgi:MFS family permease
MKLPRRASVDPARTHGRRWIILVVLSLSVLLVAMDNTIVNVALPTINSQFATSTSDLQWVVDIYTVFFAGLLLVFGNIGDRIGRKRVLQIGLALFAITSFAAAQTTSVAQLIAARG